MATVEFCEKEKFNTFIVNKSKMTIWEWVTLKTSKIFACNLRFLTQN